MVKPWELCYQVGNIVRICRLPKRGKRLGFTIGSLHTIPEPPANSIQSAGAIWLKGMDGKLHELPFYCWEWTGKIVSKQTIGIKRARKCKQM